MTITIANVTTSDDFSINELTTGSKDGNGVFDKMMGIIGLHLYDEYENHRIRGTDYANAYIQALNHALNQATGYALNRAKLGLEMQMLEAQIQKVAADTVLTVKQGALVDAQTAKESLEVTKLEWEIDHKLPKELQMIDAQIANMKAEVALKEYELKVIKPVQLAIQQAELRLKELQIPLMQKELELKDKQLDIAIKDLEIKGQQLEIAKYELQFKLPAEVKSIQAQGDLYAQKVITEKAQTDNSVVGDGSVINLNNKVLAEQAKSFLRDGKLKLANMLIDTWKIRRNDDPDEAPVNDINKLNDKKIGETVDAVFTSVELNP